MERLDDREMPIVTTFDGAGGVDGGVCSEGGGVGGGGGGGGVTDGGDITGRGEQMSTNNGLLLPSSASSSSSSPEHGRGDRGRGGGGSVDDANAGNVHDMITTTDATDTTNEHTIAPIAMLCNNNNNHNNHNHHDNNNHHQQRTIYTKLFKFPAAIGYPADTTNIHSQHKFLCPLSEFRHKLLDMMMGVVQLIHSLHQENVSVAVLGDYVDLEWLSDMAWSLGKLMIDHGSRDLPSSSSVYPMEVCSQSAMGSLNTHNSPTHNDSDTHNDSTIIAITNDSTPITHRLDYPITINDTIISLKKTPPIMNESSHPDTLCEMRESRLLAADFLMVAADLYALLPSSNVSVSQRNQGMCLLLAAAALMDAVTFDDLLAGSITRGNGGGGNGSATASTNHPPPLGSRWIEQCLHRVRQNAATARDLLVAEGADLLGLRFGGGDDDDEGLSQLRSMALVIEFAALCKISTGDAGTAGGQGLAQGPGQGPGQDNHPLQTFLHTKENDLLSLSAVQLKLCANIASTEKGGTVDVVRKLLTYSLQICSRGAPPDHILMGELFRRLIHNSPSRRDALDHIRKFEQLATGCAFSRHTDMGDDDEGSPTCPFDMEDVDYVASTSFNYGVTLLDFGQPGLAEVFVSKALSLLPYASSTLQLIRDRIQETYMAVLKAKEESLPLGDGLSTLATLAVSF